MTPQAESKVKKTAKEKSTITSTLTVFDINGKEVGTCDVDKTVFDGKVNKRTVEEVIVMYQANQRQGNASTKNRREVSGGGKKPWRQKGTGRARFGSSRNPIWRGGGIAFGPRPRSYATKMPRKKIALAFRSVMNTKMKEEAFRLIDQFNLEGPKTKKVADLLKALKVKRNILFIADSKNNTHLYKSARNIGKAEILDKESFNMLDLVTAHTIILEKGLFETIVKGLKNEK